MNFSTASNAFTRALEEDPYYNDSTWNVTYVDSHDYGPDMDTRYNAVLRLGQKTFHFSLHSVEFHVYTMVQKLNSKRV